MKKEKVTLKKNGESIDRSIKRQYIEILKERGEGILNNIDSVGKWKSPDGKAIHYAYGISIN